MCIYICTYIGKQPLQDYAAFQWGYGASKNGIWVGLPPPVYTGNSKGDSKYKKGGILNFALEGKYLHICSTSANVYVYKYSHETMIKRITKGAF